jgi:type I restriction enzyme S subunit
MGLGKLAINKVAVAINQDLRAIEPTTALDLDFAYLLFKSLKMVGTGVTVKGISVNKLHAMPVALPPSAEQKRIVAKVDELMALCDRLEAQQHERETRHAALARASLARFADAPTPANLSFLFHPSYAIAPADLRKSILTLAVQGKLVSQDPADEPAKRALIRLEASGGIVKTRRSVPNEVQRPDSLDTTNLPTSWAIESTARLLQLGAILDLKDGNHGANHPKVAEFTETGLPFITAAQVSDTGRIDYDGAYKISGQALERIRVGFAKQNDVIYTHKGSVGRVAICDRDCVLTPQTTYYRVNSEVLCSGFLRINLLSPLFQDQVDLVKRQTTRDFVSINAQYQFFLRIPPVAEQHRIVVKVAKLMDLVDELEAQLSASSATAANLMRALVAELTGTTRDGNICLSSVTAREQRVRPKKSWDETTQASL